ncbi:MAG: prepilin-type N-terminal cleavage/methylation domain-containing protein [Acidobacteriaceae bacterium]|nr:prepilin-type N-terminal cleavage/methylation domain-containing protein [Acidobacteriaceae bacterium]
MTGNRGTTLRRDPRGFTLIELMVVMSIIVVLTTVAIVQYRQSVVLAREAVLKDDLFKMRDAIDQYFADKNQYPGDLADLVSAGYLRALPKDPFTQSDTTWLSVLSDADPTNPAAPTGIYDIKSGADGTAIDGSNYTDW